MPALELRFVVRTRECEGRGDEGDGAEGCCRARQRHDGQVGCATQRVLCVQWGWQAWLMTAGL